MKDISNLIESKSYKIIGENTNQQGLQIILLNGESLKINVNAITYYSNKIEESNINQKKALDILFNENDSKDNILLTSFGDYVIEKPNDFIKLTNKSKEIQYIGLALQGKIMVINPILYDNLFIKQGYIIAYSNKVNILKFQSYILNLSRAYFFGRSTNFQDFRFLNGKISENGLDNYVFLQSDSLLMEKRLGKDESFNILKSSLVAFESSVKFNNKQIGLLNKAIYNSPFIEVIGPGLIIFEMSKVKKKNYSEFFYLMMIILVSSIVNILLMN